MLTPAPYMQEGICFAKGLDEFGAQSYALQLLKDIGDQSKWAQLAQLPQAADPTSAPWFCHEYERCRGTQGPPSLIMNA